MTTPDETGAEWLARENKRLSERVEKLENTMRSNAREISKLGDQLLKLTESKAALEEKYWGMRITVTDLADKMREEDE